MRETALSVCAQQNVLIMLKLCTTISAFKVCSLFGERQSEGGSESKRDLVGQPTGHDRSRGKGS